jgi:DNA-binding PadR family transcriptional regulator
MTNAELAVLSLVVEAPRHGYEIDRLIVQRGMREWTDVGFSSIYYLLGKMEKAGLVESRADETPSGPGPARKVFAPTPAGFAAWEAASIAALSVPELRHPFALGLSNLPGLPPDAALAAVREYRIQLEERMSGMLAKRDAQAPLEWFVAELFDFSEHTLRAEMTWVDGLIGRLEKREKVAVVAKLKRNQPVLAETPSLTMAVVRTVGDPAEVAGPAFNALYGAVYPLKFALKKDGVEYKIAPPRARWFNGPDWRSVPRENWTAAWAIPIPDGTTELKQKDPDTPVTIETWEYGRVAEVLHVGTYAEEEPTIELLHAFIAEQGLEISGPHEEEYLTRPDAKTPKTVIRYQVAAKK